MKKVSIVIPVIRTDKVELCIDAIVQNSGVRMDQYEIVTDVDTDGIGCPKMLKKLVEKTKYDLVMFLGDDTEPQEDFLKHAIEKMDSLPDKWGVVGLNTEDIHIEGGNPIAHWMAHKKMLDHIEGGNFFSIEYKHCWCDNELQDIANELGRWVYAEKSYIKHNHHINGTNEWDEGYQKAYTNKNMKHDGETYIKRKIARMRLKGGKLGIGFPITYDYVHKAFFQTFTQLKFPDYVQLMPKVHGHIDVVRNNIVDQALRCGCTHLLFMDTDQVYRSTDMIVKMFERMKSDNLKFLSAKVHRRYPPFDPILLKGEIGAFELISEKLTDSGEVIEIDATGTGCVMIDTSVFMEIERPYFELRKSETGKDIGEDISFCAKLKEKGHLLFCDTSFEIGHLSMMEVGGDTNKLFRKLHKMEAP